MTAATALGGLVQTVFSARILGPEGFGVLAVIFAVTGLVQLLLTMPGGDVVTTFVTRSLVEGRRDEAERVLRFALVASQGLSLAAWAAIAGIAVTTHDLLEIQAVQADAMLVYGATVMFSATYSETMAVLRLANRVSLGFVVNLAAVATRIGLSGLVWLTGGGLLELVYALVAGAAVKGTGLLVVAATSASAAGVPRLLRSASLKVPSDVVAFQAGTFSRTTIGGLNRHLDAILLTQFVGITDIGLYRGAWRIVDVAKEPLRTIQIAVKVEYSKLWFSRQGSALRRMTLRYTLLSTVLAVAGFGLLALSHEYIIRMILGPEFSGVGPLLLILLLGGLLHTSLSMAAALPVAAGQNWSLLLVEAVQCGVFIAATALLAPYYGVAAAAWARTAASLAYAAVLIPYILSILRQSDRP